jgi:hypothetical protein
MKARGRSRRDRGLFQELTHGPWTASNVLSSAFAIGVALATASLIALLAATPPYECGEDYEGPPTPFGSGGIAIALLLFGLAGFLLATGIRIGVRRDDEERPRATYSLTLALVLLAVAFAGRRRRLQQMDVLGVGRR